MARIALTEILLLLAPFLLFALYLRFGRRLDSALSGWSTKAFTVCTVIGLLLMAASLFLFEMETRGPTTGRYVPPTWKDGILVPGHFE